MSALPLCDGGISCHAWNGARTSVAVCPNNGEVHIYENCQNADPTTWTRVHVLAEHDLVVSAIDWHPTTNKLVTCSHDRNAFVWSWSDAEGKWKPSLTILRINRAAMDVKWSHDGTKFAVASGSKCVPVCHYEESNDWWISKMIKKHKSTVMQVAWHPCNQVIATGCSDFKCRVFSAFIEEVDQRTADGAGPWGETQPFGEMLCEFDQAHGWVESVAWSPAGSRLAFAGHDSSLTVAFFDGGAPTVVTSRFRFLPLVDLLFTNENTVVGVGYDFNPAVFDLAGTNVAFNRNLDAKSESKAPEAQASGFSAARNMFQSQSQRGQAKSSDDDKLWTKHENLITNIGSRDAAFSQDIHSISTTGLDGRLVTWNL